MSEKYFDTNGNGYVGIVVASVDIVMLSMAPGCVFMEGYIMGNLGFWDFRLLFFHLNIKVLLKFVDIII